MSVTIGNNFRRMHETLVDNASLASGASSASVIVSDLSQLEFYGTNTTATGTMTVEISVDLITWYATSNIINTTAGQDFHGFFNTAADFVRVRANQSMTGLTLIVSGKR